ncbi:MAG: type II toxin-antitoxin system RelE/ParE family toxin [Planctomycetaceae bacterium]
MNPVCFHPAAQAEFEKASVYYDARRSGLGSEFVDEIERLVARIRSAPETWPQYKNTTCRYASARRFPYIVYYRPVGDLIWIVAVAHGHRRPDYWLRRRIP